MINENEEFEFTYTKVAEYKNGEFVLKEPFDESGINLNEMTKGDSVQKAVEQLRDYNVEKTSVVTENQVAQIGPLSDGVYLIEGVPEKGYDIPSTLVSIPRWSTEGEALLYHVTVIPKIQRSIETVETGDTTNLMPLSILCGLSLFVIVGISGRAFFLKDR